MLRTGQLPASSQGRSSCASTPRFCSTPAVLLPGTLASLQAGLSPAGCRGLVARLPSVSLRSMNTLALELLDAQIRAKIGHSRRPGWRTTRPSDSSASEAAPSPRSRKPPDEVTVSQYARSGAAPIARRRSRCQVRKYGGAAGIGPAGVGSQFARWLGLTGSSCWSAIVREPYSATIRPGRDRQPSTVRSGSPRGRNRLRRTWSPTRTCGTAEGSGTVARSAASLRVADHPHLP